MAKRARKHNEKFAQLLKVNALDLIQRVLIIIGKPVYFILSSTIIIFLYSSYLIGSTLISLSKQLGKTLERLYKTWTAKFTKPKASKWLLNLVILKAKLNLFALGSKLRSSKTKIKKRPKTLTIFYQFSLAGFLLILTLGFGFWYIILRDLPEPAELTQRDLEVSTKIYDRNGILLYKIYRDQNRTPIALSQIPIHARLATIAIEDAEFYNHPGFSLRGILRAIIRNVQKGELAGGSTITQQLVKNALLSPEKTLPRKLKELILAVQVELSFSKDEILEMYLNEVSYGGTAYGIQEASQVYFGKNAQDLTLGEASLLAGLPKSPSRFSPFGSHPELALARQKEVLNLMVNNKFITEEAKVGAENEILRFNQNKIDIKAPHFVMYVRELLAEMYGEETLTTGGLEVITSLDLSIQQMAENAVREEVERIKNLNVGNGAAVVVNPTTGEVLAMVGSKNYFDYQNDGNVNVAVRPRQPGSSIKVINYAHALSNGLTPASTISDTPITFSVPGSAPYTPRNYDNTYRGTITLRSALAESRNIPAVKVLASYGVEKMIELGRNMGITTWDNSSRFGLSLTLGGGEVKLIELAQVYATIANYGKRADLTSILRVTNYKGKTLMSSECKKNATSWASIVHASEATPPSCEGKEVLDKRVAFLLIDILKDNIARAPAFGLNSQLVIPKHNEVAVKTGTSNDLRDNLTVGFNQDYVVAVWVGNNNNAPMSRIASGVTGAAPIWNRIMVSLLANTSNHDWVIPEGVIKLPICTLTGTLTCEGCPTRGEWFLEEATPTRACSPEVIERIRLEREEQEKQRLEGQIIEPAASFP